VDRAAGRSSQPGAKLPTALRAKLLSLSLYVDRALLQLRVTRKRAPLDALIDINRNIAQGLLAASGDA
jgi:flagellar biosynthesis regulator FlaF